MFFSSHRRGIYFWPAADVLARRLFVSLFRCDVFILDSANRMQHHTRHSSRAATAIRCRNDCLPVPAAGVYVFDPLVNVCECGDYGQKCAYLFV